MSALFGVFDRSGLHVPAVHLDMMAAQLSGLGTGGRRHVCDSGIGLGCLWWDDVAGVGRDASLHVDSESGLVTVAEGWLTDFDDLARALHVPSDASFAELAACLWQQRLEARFLQDLAGEFNIVIWDPRERRLRMIASPACNPVCHVWKSAQRVVFASRTRALHAVPGIEPRLDLDHLARSAVPGVGRLGRYSTFFAGVDRLRAGTIREYAQDTSSRRRWWHVDPECRLDATPDEIVEAIDARLTKVLRSRMAGGAPVGCLLSGGLDSSTVATFAHAVAERGQLTALSAVHAGTDEAAEDERPYIRVLRDHLDLDVVEVSAEGRGPFDDIRALVRTIEGPFATSRHFLYTALVNAARQRGARVVLDGFFGELGVSRDGIDTLVDELLAGRLGSAAREVRAYARAQNQPLLRSAASLLMMPIWRNRIRRRRPDVVRSLVWCPLRGSFLRDRGVDPDALAGAVEQVSAQRGGHRRTLARELEHVPGASPGFAGADDVTISWPLLDRRILELCLAAPPDLKFRDGYSRALARRLLRGKAPDAIRLRTTKLPFSPDFDRRFNSQVQSVEEELAAITDADPVREIVDIPKLQRLARHRMSDPRGGSLEGFGAMHSLPNGVYLIAFLREYMRRH